MKPLFDENLSPKLPLPLVPMLLKRALVHFVVLGLFLLSSLMGIFAAMGVCAAIWGGNIIDTVLGGNPPDRSHPAYWLFVLLMLPGTVVGCIGGIFTFLVPIYTHFDMRIFNTGPNDKGAVEWYIRTLHRLHARNWPNSALNDEPGKHRAK